jgi:hypothetical protein
MPVGTPLPEPQMPMPFLKGAATTAPRTPPVSVTGPVPVKAQQETVPIEQLQAMRDKEQAPAAPVSPTLQLVPMVMPQNTQLPTTPPLPSPTPKP